MVILTKQQLQQNESYEMGFLRTVSGYRKIYKKKKADIIQEIYIFSTGEKIKVATELLRYIQEYQPIEFPESCLVPPKTWKNHFVQSGDRNRTKDLKFDGINYLSVKTTITISLSVYG
jgi:hypothetical protein